MTTITEPELVDDTIAWPILLDLVSCLCAEVENAGLPPVCICSPMPGAAIAVDYVTPEVGMAWVRLTGAFPSTAFPSQAGAGTSCGAPLVMQFDVGTAFCAPYPDDDGTPPGLAAQFDATRTQLAGMAAARRAIQCCLGVSSKDVLLGSYNPMGPQGGVVGGYWTVAVAQGAVKPVNGGVHRAR